MNEPSWADLFRLLSGMSRLFQSCTDEQEFLDVCEWYVPRIFPDFSGALHLFASADSEALSLAWGEAGPAAEAPGREERAALVPGAPVLTEPEDDGCAALSVPLFAAKQPLGVLTLVSGSQEALADVQGLALVTAEQLALTVDNLRVRSRLRDLALRDALTGLFNRRHFDSTMNKETRTAAESGAPLCVVMFDIDHFKKLNDTKGHDAGDAALQAVGNFLGSLAGPDAVPCRYGGEEFFFVLRNTEYEAALRLAEDIRQGIAALEITHQGVQVSPIHVSVGVARFPDHGATPEALAKAADDCLYAAKEGGRNRVVGYASLKPGGAQA
ncbi:GGDEF domain-containing protein [Desulfocurvus sp. DL9XJH121]